MPHLDLRRSRSIQPKIEDPKYGQRLRHDNAVRPASRRVKRSAAPGPAPTRYTMPPLRAARQAHLQPRIQLANQPKTRQTIAQGQRTPYPRAVRMHRHRTWTVMRCGGKKHVTIAAFEANDAKHPWARAAATMASFNAWSSVAATTNQDNDVISFKSALMPGELTGCRQTGHHRPACGATTVTWAPCACRRPRLRPPPASPPPITRHWRPRTRTARVRNSSSGNDSVIRNRFTAADKAGTSPAMPARLP